MRSADMASAKSAWPNADQCRKRDDDTSVAVPGCRDTPKTKRNIWNHSISRSQKSIGFLGTKRSPSRKQPQNRANHIRNRAERGAQQVHERDANNNHVRMKSANVPCT